VRALVRTLGSRMGLRPRLGRDRGLSGNRNVSRIPSTRQSGPGWSIEHPGYREMEALAPFRDRTSSAVCCGGGSARASRRSNPVSRSGCGNCLRRRTPS
jgi:hypothetical protein